MLRTSNPKNESKAFMQRELRELLKEINQFRLPKASSTFGGAGLIITADPNRRGTEQDIIVLSDDASTLSWLVYRLQNIFNPDYLYIGTQINRAQSLGLNTRQQMKYVITSLMKTTF